MVCPSPPNILSAPSPREIILSPSPLVTMLSPFSLFMFFSGAPPSIPIANPCFVYALSPWPCPSDIAGSVSVGRRYAASWDSSKYRSGLEKRKGGGRCQLKQSYDLFILVAEKNQLESVLAAVVVVKEMGEGGDRDLFCLGVGASAREQDCEFQMKSIRGGSSLLPVVLGFWPGAREGRPTGAGGGGGWRRWRWRERGRGMGLGT